MRLALHAALLVLAATGCSAELPPLLNPNLNAGQIAALPSHVGLRDAHYVSVYTGADGTKYQQLSGTVQLQPVRALSQTLTPGVGPAPIAPSEYREVNGVTYSQLLPGWSHPRWLASGTSSGVLPVGNPVYFDLWWRLGRFQVEGQEGSTVDRAWRLVSPQANGKGGPAALRIWIRQRDGYPLQYRLSTGNGTATTLTLDRFNSGARVKVPPASELMPPPPGVPVAGQLPFSGGTLRVLSVDYAFHGSLVPAPTAAGSHLVGIEVYVDAPRTVYMLADIAHWELLDAAGNAYPSQTAGGGVYSGKGGGSDMLAFFAVPDSASRPFTLHALFNDVPPSRKVVLDGLIKLS